MNFSFLLFLFSVNRVPGGPTGTWDVYPQQRARPDETIIPRERAAIYFIARVPENEHASYDEWFVNRVLGRELRFLQAFS